MIDYKNLDTKTGKWERKDGVLIWTKNKNDDSSVSPKGGTAAAAANPADLKDVGLSDLVGLSTSTNPRPRMFRRHR